MTGAPAGQTGKSLVSLLHGQAVADWRDVALVEHHGSNFDPADPDLAEPNSGNPPTYAALRTKGFVYVEYVGGETEYHARATDPDELDNPAAALTALRALGPVLPGHEPGRPRGGGRGRRGGAALEARRGLPPPPPPPAPVTVFVRVLDEAKEPVASAEIAFTGRRRAPSRGQRLPA